ncbi:hypothetical protein J6590_035600 [Homalodisca vitripennis]|nr:hypothetical protein J6590_092055 [Homalodisca vitripennis]KAG8336900.1 hypothetical protein J6590_035600 [Homalodisca vitripennis]
MYPFIFLAPSRYHQQCSHDPSISRGGWGVRNAGERGRQVGSSTDFLGHYQRRQEQYRPLVAEERRIVPPLASFRKTFSTQKLHRMQCAGGLPEAPWPCS